MPELLLLRMVACTGSSRRLIGGNSDNGGLSNVNWNDSDDRNDNIGFRPLSVSRPNLPHCLDRKQCGRFLGSGSFDPSAELAPDFARPVGKVEVSFFGKRIYVFRDTKHDFEKIQRATCFQEQIFPGVIADGVGSHDKTQKIHGEHLETFANRISVWLWEFSRPLMNSKNQLIRTMENRQLKSVGGGG